MQIAHGPLGARKGVYTISFHQDHQDFRIELCGIFNNLGCKNLLIKKEETKKVDPDDKWGELFGG